MRSLACACATAVLFWLVPGASAQPVISRLDATFIESALPGGAATDAGMDTNAIALTVTGTGFIGGEIIPTVTWTAGTPASSIELPVFNVTDTEILAEIPGNLIAEPGTAQIQVVLPTGGSSNAATFTINPLPSARLLPDGTAGVPYSAPLVQGGTPPFTVSGTLPPWLQFNSDGTVSGTPPQAAQGTTFDLTVVDAWEQQVTGTWVINSIAPPAPTFIITTPSPLPDGAVGAPYVLAFAASGGQPVWSLAPNFVFPPGLSLSPSGVLSGTPTRAGTFDFAVRATLPAAQAPIFATKTFRLVVTANLLKVLTTNLPDATQGTAYAAALSADGGTPAYSWFITAGSLPPGLTLNAATGNVAGTPSQAGTYNFTVEVQDASGQTATGPVTLLVRTNAPRLTISTASPLPAAPAGVPIAQAFSASGGLPPYTWAVSGGSLPPGVTFSAAAAALSGTPTTPGSYRFTLQVTDSQKGLAVKTFDLAVAVPALSVTTESLPQGTAGQPYTATVAAGGGTPPYSWSITGLPAGLAANPQGGIDGTPAGQGTATVIAQVTDAKGGTASKSFALVIAGLPLSITTASPLPDAVVGANYSLTFTAAGGTPPYRWAAVAGSTGPLALSPSGLLSGLPSATGTLSVTVQVTDSLDATASRAFTLTVGLPALSIVAATLPAATVGTPYSAAFATSGASGAVEWSATGVPAGLTFSAGVLAGTPEAPGAATLAVTATDAAGRTASRSFSLTVSLPALPTITFQGVPDIAGPAAQPAIGLGLSGSYPVAVTGQMTLAFAAADGGDDPTVQFSNGSRTAAFTIPAGANLATFTVPNLALQTGTVAGAITLTASLQAGGTDMTPSPAPARTIRIDPSAPVIVRLAVNRTAAGLDVSVTGYSTTREVTQAIFHFNPAAGTTVQTPDLTISVNSAFATWYQDPASRAFGSQFTFAQPFTLQGNQNGIGSVTVTLVNSVGRSDAATANVP